MMMSKYTQSWPRSPSTRRPVAFFQMRSPMTEPPCTRKKRGTRESHPRPMARIVHSWKRPDARNVPSTRPTSPAILHPGMPPNTRNVCRNSWCQRFAQNSCSDCATQSPRAVHHGRPRARRVPESGDGKERHEVVDHAEPRDEADARQDVEGGRDEEARGPGQVREEDAAARGVADAGDQLDARVDDVEEGPAFLR